MTSKTNIKTKVDVDAIDLGFRSAGLAIIKGLSVEDLDYVQNLIKEEKYRKLYNMTKPKNTP